MLKGIIGCLVVVVVVVAIVIWAGYRKLQSFTSAGPSSTVTIHAPASRVFASIANADSLTEWREEGLGIRTSRRGLLRVGDTLELQSSAVGVQSRPTGVQTRSTGDSAPRRAYWVVSAVTPNKLLALETRDDSAGVTLLTRRDSLISLGDSTQVVSTIAAPVMDMIRDSIRATRRTDGRGSDSTVLEMAAKMMVAMARLQSASELKRLKARIEGHVRRDSMPKRPK